MAAARRYYVRLDFTVYLAPVLGRRFPAHGPCVLLIFAFVGVAGDDSRLRLTFNRQCVSIQEGYMEHLLNAHGGR